MKAAFILLGLGSIAIGWHSVRLCMATWFLGGALINAIRAAIEVLIAELRRRK